MSRIFAPVLALLLSASSTLVAQTTYTWNPASSGPNNWDISSLVWNTPTSGGLFNQAFVNGATNNAVLALNSGTANLTATTAISGGQLRVGSDGFTLTSGTAANNFTFAQGFQTVGGARTLNLDVGTGATSSFAASGTGDTTAGKLTLNVNSAVSGQGLRLSSSAVFGMTPNADIVVGTTTGGTSGGTRLTVASDFIMPAGVSLSLSSSAGADFRSTFASIGGSTTWNGPVALNGAGIIQFDSAANNFNIAGGVSSGGNATTLQLQGSGTGTVTGVMSGAMSLNKTNGGLWILAQQNSSFTGSAQVTNGRLQVTKLADAGQTSSLGAATGSTSNILFGQADLLNNSAILEFNGPVASSTNRNVVLQGLTGGSANYSIRSSNLSTPSATATFTGTVTSISSTATHTLILDGSNTGNNTMAGVISSTNGTTLSLAKFGTGTWILSGANTYTGTTTILGGGILVINGNQSAATGAVTTNSASAGGGHLAGNGTIGGTVLITNSSYIRGDSGTGTGNLTLLADTTINSASTTFPRGTIRTQLATSSGVINSNSKLALSGANTDLIFDNLTGTNRFGITLSNDAGLIAGQSYTITLATAASSANFRRGTGGTASTDPFTSADFALVSGSGVWASFEGITLLRNGTELQLTFTPVPEPTTVGLVAAVGGLLLGVRRRFRR